MTTTIEQQINTLFSLVEGLECCISENKYSEFSQQQEILAYKMHQILGNASQDELLSVIVQLKKIETLMLSIQHNATTLQTELKNKSLQQQRAKKRVNAYK